MTCRGDKDQNEDAAVAELDYRSCLLTIDAIGSLDLEL